MERIDLMRTIICLTDYVEELCKDIIYLGADDVGLRTDRQRKIAKTTAEIRRRILPLLQEAERDAKSKG